MDSPPILFFTDACVLAPLVSGVFLMARSGVTTPDAIARVQSMLGAVNARVVGTILNAIPGADGFGSYGYGHGYFYDDSDYYDVDDGLKSDGASGRLRSIARRFVSRVRRWWP